VCYIRKESKGNNTIIFIYLQEINSKMGAILIKDKYLFLSPLYILIFCLNKALKLLKG
jgi:hypothetical protein